MTTQDICFTPAVELAAMIRDGGSFHGELLRTPIQWDNGFVVIPTAPGLGVELDEDVARAHPYDGDGLHLTMWDEPIDRAEFGGVGALGGQFDRRPGCVDVVPAPGSVQLGIATQRHHRVDRRGPADAAPALVRHRRTPGRPRRRERRERSTRHGDRCEEVGAAERTVEIIGSEVGACFQQRHRAGGVGRQSCRHHASCRAGTDHDRRAFAEPIR